MEELLGCWLKAGESLLPHNSSTKCFTSADHARRRRRLLWWLLLWGGQLARGPVGLPLKKWVCTCCCELKHRGRCVSTEYQCSRLISSYDEQRNRCQSGYVGRGDETVCCDAALPHTPWQHLPSGSRGIGDA